MRGGDYVDEYASIQGNVLQLLIVMVVSLVITFAVTAYTVTRRDPSHGAQKKEEQA